MTMMHENKGIIWSGVRKDRDVDDLIFCDYEQESEKQPVTVSDR